MVPEIYPKVCGNTSGDAGCGSTLGRVGSDGVAKEGPKHTPN